MANITIYPRQALPDNMLFDRFERDGVLCVSLEEGQLPNSMAVCLPNDSGE